MKFLCVQCDQQMSLSEAGPPDEGGSLSIEYGCPECDTRIRMLTNASETQVVTSLGVKIGKGEEEASGCPFGGMLQEMEQEKSNEGPSWTQEADRRLQNIPEFVRPMARQGIEHYARTHGYGVIDEKVLDEARTEFGM